MKGGTVLESVSLQSPLCKAAVEGPGQLPLGLLGTSVRSGLSGPTAPGQLQGPWLEMNKKSIQSSRAAMGCQSAECLLTLVKVNGTTEKMEAR